MNSLIEIEIANKVSLLGGTCYYVGGYVRDEILGVSSFDKDVEIFGIEKETLEKIFCEYSDADFSEKKYGVYKLKGVDFALPRTEEKTGEKHGDFVINVNPFMSLEDAANRRDFTVNAIYKNVLTGKIIDKIGGTSDIKNKVLKAVNPERFCEDGLRVLRGAGLSARFGFKVEPETLNLFKKADVTHLSGERVYNETVKALLLAERPSEYFKVLKSCGKLSFWFPELENLIGIKQNPKYHTEGDAFFHTLLVLDIAATFRPEVSKPSEFMLSALSHDFGKAVCTEMQSGFFHTKGHERESAVLSEKFLRRLHANKCVIDYVFIASLLHMEPNKLAGADAPIKDTNALFIKHKYPVDLIYLSRADSLGSKSVKENTNYLPWLKERLQAYYKSISFGEVSGKDLINAGLTPNKDFREIIEYAKQLILDGEIKETAIEKAVEKYSLR